MGLEIDGFALHCAGDGRPPLANDCLPHFRHADHAGKGGTPATMQACSTVPQHLAQSPSTKEIFNFSKTYSPPLD